MIRLVTLEDPMFRDFSFLAAARPCSWGMVGEAHGWPRCTRGAGVARSLQCERPQTIYPVSRGPRAPTARRFIRTFRDS